MDLGSLTAVIARNDYGWVFEEAWKDVDLAPVSLRRRVWVRVLGSLRACATTLRGPQRLLHDRR